MQQIIPQIEIAELFKKSQNVHLVKDGVRLVPKMAKMPILSQRWAKMAILFCVQAGINTDVGKSPKMCLNTKMLRLSTSVQTHEHSVQAYLSKGPTGLYLPLNCHDTSILSQNVHLVPTMGPSCPKTAKNPSWPRWPQFNLGQKLPKFNLGQRWPKFRLVQDGQNSTLSKMAKLPSCPRWPKFCPVQDGQNVVLSKMAKMFVLYKTAKMSVWSKTAGPIFSLKGKIGDLFSL